MGKKVVYILGAGFSRPFGIPVMSEFVKAARTIHERDPVLFDFGHALDSFKEFKKITYSYAADILNIEEILSILEMRLMCGDNMDSRCTRDALELLVTQTIDYYTPSLTLNNFSFEDPNNLINLVGATTADLPEHPLAGTHKVDGHSRNLFCFLSMVSNLRYTLELPGGRPKLRITNGVSDHSYTILTLNYDDLVLQTLNNIRN